MTLQGFQQALSELVLSPDLRARVADREADALAAFDLDSREKRRLLAIAGQSGLDTGVLIHRSFRLSMLVRSLPRTCRLLGDGLSDLVHEYWRENLPLHYNFAWESGRFAGFLRDRMRRNALDEPLLRDTLRIDLAIMALQRRLAPEQVDLDERADLAAPPEPDRLVLVCDHDPAILLADHEADHETDPAPESPPEASAGDHRLVVQRRSDGSVAFEWT